MGNSTLVRSIAPAFGIIVFGSLLTAASAATSTYSGEPVPLGNGAVNTYLTLADDAKPVAIGIRMTEAALEGLPAEPNNTNRCFDVNGDGKLEAMVECLGEHEIVMTWPPELDQADVPFKWMGFGWAAHGHNPPNVYDVPHFDVHFYMADHDAVMGIRTGPCGELVNCDDLERARMPVPASFVPAGYVEVGAVVAEMGNHLINTAAPELASPPEPFTHTLIYGAFDGQITFLEPMVTRSFLLGKPDVCAPVPQPAAWQTRGHYPTEYCIRYLPNEAAVTISLEGFVNADAAEWRRSKTSGDHWINGDQRGQTRLIH